MTAAASTALRTYAAWKWPNFNHKGRVRELCRELTRWSDRRVRSIYNGEPSVRLRADEQSDIDQLTEGARHALRKSQEEYRHLEARIAALEAAFAAGDEEHGRPFLDGYRAVALGEGR